MNKKGQTLILFVIILPLLFGVFFFVFFKASMVYEAKKISNISTLFKTNYKFKQVDIEILQGFFKLNGLEVEVLSFDEETGDYEILYEKDYLFKKIKVKKKDSFNRKFLYEEKLDDGVLEFVGPSIVYLNDLFFEFKDEFVVSKDGLDVLINIDGKEKTLTLDEVFVKSLSLPNL